MNSLLDIWIHQGLVSASVAFLTSSVLARLVVRQRVVYGRNKGDSVGRVGVDFSSGFFRDGSGAEAFLDELKAFCELLVDDEVVVDAAREQCLFYSKWQGLPACKLQVLDGVYHFGGFERGDFCCFFSTMNIELAFKVLVLRK